MTTQELITQLTALADLQDAASPGPWRLGYKGEVIFDFNNDIVCDCVDMRNRPVLLATRTAPFREAAEALNIQQIKIDTLLHDMEVFLNERDQLRAELEERDLADITGCHAHGCLVSPADGQGTNSGCQCKPWKLHGVIRKLRADIEQMDLDNDRLTLKVMELVNQRNSLQAQLDAAKATISNIETGMGLRIAAAEAQLATRTDGILPCPVCENPPRKWMCKRCGLSGPDNDPTGAGWNAMVAEMEKQG